jgi:hypothetical protein
MLKPGMRIFMARSSPTLEEIKAQSKERYCLVQCCTEVYTVVVLRNGALICKHTRTTRIKAQARRRCRSRRHESRKKPHLGDTLALSSHPTSSGASNDIVGMCGLRYREAKRKISTLLLILHFSIPLTELGTTSTVLSPSSAVLSKPLLRSLALSRLTILSSCLISCTLLLSLVEHRVVSHHDNALYSLRPRLAPRVCQMPASGSPPGVFYRGSCRYLASPATLTAANR